MTTAKVKQILVNSPQKDKINNCWKQKGHEQRNVGLDSLQAPSHLVLLANCDVRVISTVQMKKPTPRENEIAQGDKAMTLRKEEVAFCVISQKSAD